MTENRKPTEAEDKTARHLEYFWDMICKVQEVQKALAIQETVLADLIEILKLGNLPIPIDYDEVFYALEAMGKATKQMNDKLGDVENLADILCREFTEEKNILFSVLLDDMRMYADSGRLHD